jgi:transporter family protein
MASKAFVYALLAAIIWGLAPAFEKTGLRGRIDPYVGVMIRTIPIVILSIAGLFLLGKVEELAHIETRNIIFLVIGGLLAGFLGQLALYNALKAGEASIVVPISATYPLVTLIIAVLFLGESVTFTKVLGILLVISGITLLR